MKKSIIILIAVFLLTGCSQENTSENVYIEKINALETEVENLTKQIITLTEVQTQAQEDPEKGVNEAVDNRVIETVGDKVFRLEYKGYNKHEDGIVLVLEALDETLEIIWIETWNGIQPTELEGRSPVAVYEEKLLMVVDGDLYIMDVQTGEIYSKTEQVGQSSVAPLVDSDGVIFTIGQYEPYVSAIDQSGQILWQSYDEELTHAYSIVFENEKLVIEAIEGRVTMDKQGNILE